MMGKSVIVYGTAYCPFCDRAKALLFNKGVDFREIRVDENPKMREQMLAAAPGARTVPQIIIHGKPIGGFDNLLALEQSGELDKLLQSEE